MARPFAVTGCNSRIQSHYTTRRRKPQETFQNISGVLRARRMSCYSGDPMGKRGPKGDDRPEVSFHIEQTALDALVELRPHTGMSPDEIVGLMTHLVVADPEHATERITAIFSPLLKPTAPASAKKVTRLESAARQDSTG